MKTQRFFELNSYYSILHFLQVNVGSQIQGIKKRGATHCSSSVKGGRKALDNGMVTAAPRIYAENHHANLVIGFKASYTLLQQDIDTTFFFYSRKCDIVTDVISLFIP